MWDTLKTEEKPAPALLELAGGFPGILTTIISQNSSLNFVK